jgi:hypothetical protein
MFGYNDKEIVLLRDILHELCEIRKELFSSKSSELLITFTNGENNFMSTASITLNPPLTIMGVATETVNNQSYNPVPSDLTWSVQDSSIVSFVTNSDGTAVFTPLAVGNTQVGCSDGKTGNSGIGTLTVTEGVAGTLTITFVAPSIPGTTASSIKKV